MYYYLQIMSTGSAYVVQAVGNASKLNDISAEALRIVEKIDLLAQKLSNKVDKEVKEMCAQGDTTKAKRVTAMRHVLEDLSEKKNQISLRNYDLIDQHVQLVDKEFKVLETAIKLHGSAILPAEPLEPVPTTGRKRGRVAANKQMDEAPPPSSVDPNEPVYCTCRRVAFGSMVACDNEECPIEWFHCPCVNLTKVPKNEWLCPQCSQKLKKKH